MGASSSLYCKVESTRESEQTSILCSNQHEVSFCIENGERFQFSEKMELIQFVPSIRDYIRDRGVGGIVDALQENTSLTSLKLDSQGISNVGANLLGEALKVNSTLSILNLTRNFRISNKGIAAICNGLKLNTALSQLSLNWCNISHETSSDIASLLRLNTTLTKLELRGMKITDRGLPAITTALRVNSTLTHLNLKCSKITISGLFPLVTLLKTNTTLNTLNLSGNKMGDEGGMALGEVLIHNTTLKDLDLTKTRISEDGSLHLLRGLKYNTSLTQLSLLLNFSISEETKKLIKEELSINQDVRVKNKKKRLTDVIPLLWPISRILWIGIFKETPKECPITTLPVLILKKKILYHFVSKCLLFKKD